MLGHGEVNVVERVALHGDQRVGDVGGLRRDAQHEVVAGLRLALQLFPLDGVGENFCRVADVLGVDGLGEEDVLHFVGRVALVECHGVGELDGVLPLSASAGKPCLAPVDDDAVAYEHLAARLCGEVGLDERGLLEGVGLRVVGLCPAVLGRERAFPALLRGVGGYDDGVVVEAEEQHVALAVVLQQREVERAGRVLHEAVCRHLNGEDARGVLLPLAEVCLRYGEGRCGELRDLVFRGVLVQCLIGHQAVELHHLHVVVELHERCVAVQRRRCPCE